jgi:hypothetical protein
MTSVKSLFSRVYKVSAQCCAFIIFSGSCIELIKNFQFPRESVRFVCISINIIDLFHSVHLCEFNVHEFIKIKMNYLFYSIRVSEFNVYKFI